MAREDDVRLDDAALLRAWESASRLSRPWRELALLEAASGEPVQSLARLPVGERDRRLLALSESTFGGPLDCETSCPACGARLELALDPAALGRPPRDAAAGDLSVSDGGWSVTFRLPDSSDVAACLASPRDAAEVLLERCVVTARREGEESDAAALPAPLLEKVAAAMADLDPQAELLLDVSCPECGHRWRATFDPAAFLLAELDGLAERLTSEVDVLARVYGWREADILALGPRRRRRYLELALR